MKPGDIEEIMGSLVELHSLRAKPELNGLTGIIIGSASKTFPTSL
jgi:hypothetical protein